MFQSISHIRVRYAETDRMGYVHHSHYALYMEEARMKLLMEMGIDCKVLEEEGVIMPVAEMATRFSNPLYYGDVLKVETTFEPSDQPKLLFRYKIYKQDGKLVCRSHTCLVFAEKESGRLITDMPLERFNMNALL